MKLQRLQMATKHIMTKSEIPQAFDRWQFPLVALRPGVIAYKQPITVLRCQRISVLKLFWTKIHYYSWAKECDGSRSFINLKEFLIHFG
jgi:hypothetical protein